MLDCAVTRIFSHGGKHSITQSFLFSFSIKSFPSLCACVFNFDISRHRRNVEYPHIPTESLFYGYVSLLSIQPRCTPDRRFVGRKALSRFFTGPVTVSLYAVQQSGGGISDIHLNRKSLPTHHSPGQTLIYTALHHTYSSKLIPKHDRLHSILLSSIGSS